MIDFMNFRRLFHIQVPYMCSITAMNPEHPSKFALCDHETVTVIVKHFHRKVHCAPVHGSITTKTL
jgi:hypothetical protein